jgi:hypothetical protein
VIAVWINWQLVGAADVGVVEEVEELGSEAKPHAVLAGN